MVLALAGGRWVCRAGVDSLIHLPTENRQDDGVGRESYGKGPSFPAHSFQHTASDPVPGCPRSGQLGPHPFQEGAQRELLGK